MNRRLGFCLLLGGVTLMSCDRPVDQPESARSPSVAVVGNPRVAEAVSSVSPPSVTEDDPPQVAAPPSAVGKSKTALQASPLLRVEGYREHDLQPGVQLHVWDIRAYGLKKLTTSMIIIRDGEPQNAAEVEFQWEKWDKTQQPSSGQIVLLMQDGQLFDVKDKRVPLLSVDFAKPPNNMRTGTTGYVPIQGNLAPSKGTSIRTGEPSNLLPWQDREGSPPRGAVHPPEWAESQSRTV